MVDAPPRRACSKSTARRDGRAVMAHMMAQLWRRTTPGSQQPPPAETGRPAPAPATSIHAMSKLGPLLCWAVVFADIGTSVYYVPGILYGQFGRLAGLFVTLTLVAFVLLALKYAEVSVRFPEGGGVVTVSARALNPWAGALGGMFILVDYFLTAAISSLSGLQYLQDVIPPIKPFVLIGTVVVLALLGVLNWWGIRESAMVSLVIAIAAFISDIVVIVAVAFTVPLSEIGRLITGILHGSPLTPVTMLTGFAGAFLAFSGLESISQLSPVMRRPRSRTVTVALSLVVITVGFTSPLLTILSTSLLDGRHSRLLAHPIAVIDPNQFISQLGQAAAGPVIGVATAIIASALLIFASNTAIIGTYHVFLALSRMSFFPSIVEKRDKRRDTPIFSIGLATIIPIAILVFANGQINLLGQLYAFGLLGAFSLTCISMDVLRLRERRGGSKPVTLREEEQVADAAEDARLRAAGALPPPRIVESGFDDDVGDDLLLPGAAPSALAPAPAPSLRSQAGELWRRYWPTLNFGLGILTTLLVLTAWVTNLVSKRDATIFGGSLTVVGMAIAIWHHNRQVAGGTATVQPSWAISASPDSVFAIVRSGSPDNAAVIQSAFDAAHGRKVLVLFLASHAPVAPRFMAINDEPSADHEAQAAFRLALQLATQTHTPAQVFYRIGSVAAAVSLWRVARSPEVVTDAEIGRAFAHSAPPIYIRYRRTDGATITHLILRAREETPVVTGAPGGAPPTPLFRSAPRPGEPATTPATHADDLDSLDLSDDSSLEQYRTLEDLLPAANGRMGGVPGPNDVSGANGVNEVNEVNGHGTAPDQTPDGDTHPRYTVKMISGAKPSPSGVHEAPRPAIPPREAGANVPGEVRRMREPTPIESDDEEWEWIDDEPVLRSESGDGRNGQNDRPPESGTDEAPGE